MSDNLYVFTVLLIAATCIVIFGVRALAAWRGARAHEAREDAYRELATGAAAVQGEAAARLANLQSEISNVATRLAAIETLLRSVE